MGPGARNREASAGQTQPPRFLGSQQPLPSVRVCVITCALDTATWLCQAYSLPLLLCPGDAMLIGSHTSLVLNWTAEFRSLGPTEEYRCAYFEPAILMKQLIAIPVRDLPVRNISHSHVHVRLSAPMLRTTHRSLGPKGRTAGGSSKRASARSFRGPLTARCRPNWIQQSVVHHRACGPEPAMRGRRWRNGLVIRAVYVPN
jgi:hypothetical protein